MLATLNFNSLLHWSTFTKTFPVKIRDERQIVRSLYLKGLFAFPYALGFAEEKKIKIYHCPLQGTAPGIPLDIWSIAFIPYTLNLPISLLPILKLSPYYGPQLQ